MLSPVINSIQVHNECTNCIHNTNENRLNNSITPSLAVQSQSGRIKQMTPDKVYAVYVLYSEGALLTGPSFPVSGLRQHVCGRNGKQRTLLTDVFLRDS